MSFHPARILLLTPTFGVGIYICLYVWASFLYPGGSQNDPASIGFDWIYNYWCDLMNDFAGNGERNKASSIAITAQVILCCSLAAFWMIFPSVFPGRRAALATSALGVISMLAALFLFTSYHNAVIDLSGSTGAIAMLITFHQLYRMGRFGFVLLGGCCFLFAALNYTIYLTRFGIPVLPAIQKVTFLLTLTWFCLLNILAYKLANGLSRN